MEKENQNCLIVHNLGGFSVYWNGRKIVDSSSSGVTQSVVVLQRLLHFYREGTPRAQLIKMLFHDRDVQDAAHNLQVLFYNLRKMLRRIGLPEINYFPQQNNVYYWTSEIPVLEDAEQFELLCNAAEIAPEGQEQLRLYLEAIQLYNGPFLAARSSNIWAAQETARYEKLFGECVERAGAILRKAQNYPRLEWLGQYASRVQPYYGWEYLTMEALIEQKRYAEAKKLYSDTELCYLAEMGLPVGERIVEQYKRVPTIPTADALRPEQIWSRITVGDAGIGGYLCSWPVFETLCRMVHRQMSYNGNVSYLVCMGLNSAEKDKKPSREETDRLKEAIVQALRPVDVLTQTDCSHFVILLPEAEEGECRSIVKRVIHLFGEYGGRTKVSHSEVPLSSDGVEMENVS